MPLLESWWTHDSSLFQTALDVFLEAFKSFKQAQRYTEDPDVTTYTDILALLNEVWLWCGFGVEMLYLQSRSGEISRK